MQFIQKSYFCNLPRRKVLIIHQSIEQFQAKNPVITIGTFDGVHLGHRKVIDQLKKIAHEVDGESVIFTFYPHPRLVFNPNDTSLRLLTTLAEKELQLEYAGVDHLVLYPFTKEFAGLSYDQFISEILIEKLHMHTLVVGYDHKLGKNREGSFENIQKFAVFAKFNVVQIETFLLDHVDISSSKIRNALQQGDIETVTKYLGYRFSLHGTVTQGNQIGRKIDFPTANIVVGDPYKIVPAKGVYATTIDVDGKCYRAMLNIGFRPTIDANADHRTIEAHIFNFNRDIYQKEVTLHFYSRIRDERKFQNLDELKAQLELDKIQVEEILSSSI